MRKFLLTSVALFSTVGFALHAQLAPAPAGSLSVLDPQAQLDRFTFWDNRDWDWYKANIPFFESPDADIDRTYCYRWELVTKHMTYGSPESGYSFKEFIRAVPWGGPYGAISCPLGLQIGELRWLKNRRVTDDFIRYWFNTRGAQPRSYSNWFSTAVWDDYLVNGDKNFVIARLPDMEKQYAGWLKEHWDPQKQLFHWNGDRDGMELNIASRQTKNIGGGGDNFRPTLNSYIYGDLLATANTAELAGDSAKAADYRTKAEALRQRVQAELWDPKRQFFLDEFRNNETSADGKFSIKAGTLMYQDGQFEGSPYGRQLSGYTPWMFHLPEKDKGYEIAWKGVTDPQVFLAPYGLYTVERRDPQFFVTKPGSGGCWWSGGNWPFADAQTLLAMANVLNDYPQHVIAKADYFKVFEAYTRGQQKDGLPYIAEDSDPDTGVWINDIFQRSEHYFHSSYVDVLISGLVGLRPRADDTVQINPLVPDSWDYFALDGVAYHGHRLSIIWDRDGQRYRRGAGLSLIIDGKVADHRPTLGALEGKLPPPVALPPVDRPVNFAVNNDATYYPRIKASYTAEGTSAANLVDGTFFYTQPRPLNRWTTVGSPHATDSVEIDFGIGRPLENVKLYFLDDAGATPVRAPAAYDLQYWNGTTWAAVPGQKRTPSSPVGHRPNTVAFPVLNTSRLRAVLTPQKGAAVGLTEIEAWGHAALPLAQPKLSAGNLALGATASASFTYKGDRFERINDGNTEPGSRWTAYESPNPSDWVQLDFKAPVTIGRLTIDFYNDGRGVVPPKAYKIEAWNGSVWTEVTETSRTPGAPGAGLNEATFKPVQTGKLRVTFTHKLPGKTGVIELLAWAQ